MEKTKSKLDEYKKMRDSIMNVNPNRGSDPSKTKGFYGEIVNATENNLDRIKKGQKARVEVIDDNGMADSIIVYANGQTGRAIQDKVGYNYSQIKRMIKSGKYDGMIFSLNKDNDIFQNEEKLNECIELAKAHGIKFESSYVTEKETRRLAELALIESKIRDSIGLDKTKTPIVATGYTANKMVTDGAEDIESYIKNKTEYLRSEEFAKINQAGMDEALNSAIFAAIFSVTKNTISVVKGEENVNVAVKEVLVDTASAATLAYATGVVMEKMMLEKSDAALIVNGTIQISKQVIAYVNGEVDERQLMENVAETTAYLAAAYVGKLMGKAIGYYLAGPLGEKIGGYVGEVITTAVCSEVISTIKFNKEFEKQNNHIKSLYRNAEKEIRNSQARLEQIIQKENEELKKAIHCGFENIILGIQNNSYNQIEMGLMVIGEKFNLSAEEMRKGKVTRNTLFQNTEELILE